MRDTILTATLTFTLLAGGTAAIGSELLRTKTAPAPTPVVTLPTVMVTGQRAAPEIATLPMVTVTGRRIAQAPVVTLPTVVVTGKRPAIQLAIDDTEPRQVQ